LSADPATKDEASAAVRKLIEEVKLVPQYGKLHVEIRGALAEVPHYQKTTSMVDQF